jgi:peroxiredoxin
MVSLDTPERNKEFAESVGAGFVLLGDPEKKAAVAYGVASEDSSYARRWTYYIDGSGIIRYIDRDVSTATHGEDMLRTIGELGLSSRSESVP